MEKGQRVGGFLSLKKGLSLPAKTRESNFMPKNKTPSQFLPALLLFCCVGFLCAEEPEPDLKPVISRAGVLIFKDDFDKEKIRPEWKGLHGTRWQITGGALRGEPSTKDTSKRRLPRGTRAIAGAPPVAG